LPLEHLAPHRVLVYLGVNCSEGGLLSFDIQGYVVLPARFASGNASTTGEATSGVSRDHVVLDPSIYTLAPADIPVEPYADMYRAAVAQRPVERQAPDQYLIWAATTGSLSTLENDSFVLEGAPTDATPSKGSLTVSDTRPLQGDHTDGTLTFYVRDGGGRDLGYVTGMTVKRGDTGTKIIVLRASPAPLPSFDSALTDPTTGKTVLDSFTAALLGGGFSKERGDSVTAVSYVLATPKFWWSRNDSALTRFGWDGGKSTWTPLKGSTPVDLGPADPEKESYTLSPPPARYSVGESLPGLPSAPESYALIRSGVYPDSSSTPLGVQVVSDASTETAIGWSGLGDPDAVVGLTNGILILNPAWLKLNAGRPLWYNPEGFPEDSEGDLGSLVDLQADSNYNHPVLSPVPGPTDRPMVRIGFRRYLTPVAVEADALLPLPGDPLLAGGGTFYWSITTGKTSFSEDDISRATPGAAGYEITYLGSTLYYDGVSMNTQPCPLQVPLPAVIDGGASAIPITGEGDGGVGVPSSGDVFIQRAVAMPPPGASGVLWVPDGSGDLPDLTSGSPETRPNGTGLKRQVPGIGDSFFFSSGYAFEDLKVVEYDDDLPKLKIKVKRNEAAVSRLPWGSLPGNPAYLADASRVQLRRRQVRGEALYFTQANLTPSVYSDSARIFSRYEGKFVLIGTEVFRFSIDGGTHEWLAAALAAPLNGESYTAQEIADSLNVVIAAGAGVGSAAVVRGKIVLQAGISPTYQGIVEIGWNVVDAARPRNWEDLSGNAVLGFLPGWRVDTTDSTYRWQPDSGIAFGVFRSPDNLDRSSTTADVRATASIGFKRDSGRVLLSLDSQPSIAIENPPLVDMPGFDDGVHFKTFSGLKEVLLSNYGLYRGFGVRYDWANKMLLWTSLGVTRNTPILSTTGDLQLNDVSVFPETLSSAAMAPTDSGFGAYLKRVGALLFQELTLGTNFLAVGEGGPGIASLIEKEGPQTYDGGSGEGTLSGTFSNPVFSPEGTLNQVLQDAMLSAIEVGYLLQILNGESAGIYVVTDVEQPAGTTTVLTLSPPPAFAETGLSWRVFEAQLVDDYDAALIADIQLTEFNHFSQEPWNIRVLTPLGTTGSVLAKAWVEEALASNRACQIRFGVDQPPSDSSASVFYLETEGIGPIQSEGLEVPDLSDPHYTESSPGAAYFQLRAGSAVYNTASSTLAIVSTFTVTTPPGIVEVGLSGSGIAGQIRVGSDIIAEVSGETVYYAQVFRAAASLPAGSAEVDPASGKVSLSAADLASQVGKEAYFLENYDVVGNKDASINPLNGSLLLGKPLRAFQIVESQYFQADSNGDKKLDEEGELIEVIEYLPMIVRLETCTRVDSKTYAFNPKGRTLTALGSEALWVGVNLQNYAGVITAVVNADSTITFVSDVDEADKVQINYAVLEAFGSEQPFSVSTSPVYRKPFFLEANQTSFDLTSDRTSDLVVGQLLSVGPALFYLKGVSYDSATDLTSVVIWPPVPLEVGSRAPSKGAGMATSNFPVAITVDPADPVAGGGAEGFWATVDQALTPMLPVSRGNSQISFVGDLTDFTKLDHVLEVAGVPYLVVNAALSDDGRYTVISLSVPTQTAHTDADVVRVSVRRVYTPPSPYHFSGIKPTQVGEDYLLFLMGRRDDEANLIPGVQLTDGIHFEADPATGDILFKSPIQEALKPWETLQASYVASDLIGPVLEDGAVVAPSYRAQYLHAGEPTEQNGFLGSTLTARYTFLNPDAFFAEISPMADYLAVVAASSARKSQSSARSTGPVLAFPGETDPSTQGGLGLRGEVHDLQNQDAAARTYVEFYNGVVVAFEQVLEALDGRIIGDRDGKFRFFIGHGKRYAPPGYEDEISRELVIRLIWREIINTWSPAIVADNGWFTEDDPVFSPPTGFTLDSTGPPSPRPGDVDGITPDPFALSYFTEMQRRRVKNDMDDKLLIGLGRFRGIAALFPSFDVPGLFKQMWQDSVFSRLYPERSKHFSRLLPGLEAVSGPTGFSDPGFYSMGRIIPSFGPEPGEVSAQLVRTWQSTIGAVSNPALGKINRTVSISVQDRYPRARIWFYFPQGSAELDAAANAVTTGVNTVGFATFVATPLPLGEFPIDPETGFPDFAQLLSAGIASGELYSVESGDADLSTPGFEVGQRASFGKPDGTTYSLTDSNGFALFVDTISAGCILTLRDVFENPVSGFNVFADPSTILEDLVTDGTGRGDTVFIQSPVPNPDDMPGDSDNLTPEALAAAAAAQGGYSTQFDVRVAGRTGEFRDKTLLTPQDILHLPLQKMLGQNPPAPLSCVEGSVELVNTDKKPLKLPCLLGQAADDSGDVSIPYMRGSKNEIQVLGEIALAISQLLGADTSFGVPYPAGWPSNEEQDWLAIYPDEIVMADGSIYPAYDGTLDPATLYTTQDLRPVNTIGAYAPRSAIGDARPYDFLLVEVGQPALSGHVASTGILSVGGVSGYTGVDTPPSSIEPPRFVTPAKRGDSHKYSLQAAFGYVDGVFPAGAGVLPVEVVGAGPPAWKLTLGFGSVPNIVFGSEDDPAALGGGLLDILGGSGQNAIVIRFYDPDPAAATSFLGAIVLTGTGSGDTVYCWNAGTSTSTATTLDPAGAGAFLSAPDVIEIEPSIELLPLVGVIGTTFYDFTIEIDTYIRKTNSDYTVGAMAEGSGNGSQTCEISRDRLTFHERVSLQTALPRGTVAAGLAGEVLETRLNVPEVETGAGIYSTVNEAVSTNGGDPFSFLERISGSLLPYVGTFTGNATVGDEDGTLKVMAWEGHLNTPLDPAILSGIIASAVPSSDLNKTEPILNGTGRIWDDVPAPAGGAPAWNLGTPTLDGTKNWIEGISAGAGAYANVEPGDAVVVGADGDEVAWAKTGTYLVRHAVDTNTTSGGAVPLLAFAPTVSGTPCLSTVAGSREFLDLSFPVVKSYDPDTNSLVLSNVIGVPSSPTGCGFPATGHVYLILEAQYADYDAGTGAYTARFNAVYRAQYLVAPTYDSAKKEASFTISTPTLQDCANASTIDEDAWTAAATVGTRASGITYLPVSPRSSIFPANNLVGYWEDSALAPCIGGVQHLTLGNTYAPNHNSTTPAVVVGASWDTAALNIERLLSTGSPSGADNLGVRIPEGQANTVFYEERRTVVYGREYDSTGLATDSIGGVPTYLDISELTGAVSWDNIHFEAGLAPAAQVFECLLPGDLAVMGDFLDPSDAAASAGFWALSGVFLEPSIPVPVQNLTQITAPRVVSRSNASSTSASVGIRQANAYMVAPASATGEDGLSFFVRRIRRFHDIQNKISAAVAELRPLYEMRRGTVDAGATAIPGTTFTASAFNFPSVAAPDFSDPISNVNAGDMLRIIDPATLRVTDVAEVQSVDSATVMTLARPGLTIALPANATFEIYLEQAIIPQEQSNQQLYDLLTSEVVFRRFVDYQDGDTEGGKVTAFNLMEDDLVTALSGGWAAEGVAVGDYVVIDPSGTLYDPEEVGSRPFGDTLVPGRTGHGVGTGPSDLDDNRGFYKVIAVDENLDGDPAVGTLLIDGTSRFSSGDETPAENAIFGVDDGTTNSEYAVLPTVGGSLLTVGGVEGQQSLRPTSPPVAGIYGDRGATEIHKSIEPFGYTIIRPNTVFSKDATELILLMRERTLSWIEEVKDVYENPRGGDYYVFQDEDHIEDLGSPTDPTDGAGLIPNIVIESLEGLVGVQPYANTSDCLSVLGRRFFILDGRLDSLPKSATPAYTSFTENGWEQRPVLPDLIDEVLDLNDRFRAQRYSWISFRADRVNGSIMDARRAKDQLPGELEKQRELIAQKKSLDES